jgi:hypothetical protein
MNGFVGLFGDWHFWVFGAAYVVISNAVSALAMPDTTSSKFYAWFFKFANGVLASNFARAAAGKIPGNGQAMPLPGSQDVVKQMAEAAQVIKESAV